MSRMRAGLLVLAAVPATACDIVVDSGQVTTLGNGGTVLGANTPQAVTVRPGGALIVVDVAATGRGRVIEEGDRLRAPGAAIFSSGGAVRILGGTLSGGNLVFVEQDPATPPPPLDSDVIRNTTSLAPALSAIDSIVVIEGGTLASSSTFGPTEAFYVSAPVVSVARTQLGIRGGELRPGNPGAVRTIPAPMALQASESFVTISGGVFGGGILLVGSQTRITGGDIGGVTLGSLGLGTPLVPPDGTGCTEIRGGNIDSVQFTGNETLFLFGRGFNLPLGPVDITPGPFPPVLIGLPPKPPVDVRGVLEDGSPVDLQFLGSSQGTLILAGPGDDGCP